MTARHPDPATLRGSLLGVLLASFACGTAGSCSAASNNETGAPKPTQGADEGTGAPATRAEFDFFVFGRALGTIAPCGCTTEPLGGLQYAFGFIDQQSQPGARLVVEPGSFLFPDPAGAQWPRSEAEWGQAAKRAQALHGSFAALGDALVSGIGPHDVGSPAGLSPITEHPLPRVAANVAVPDVAAHRVVTLTSEGLSLRVGVTAVVDPKAPQAEQLGNIAEPIAAASQAVRAMREEGATVRVVLAHGTRPFAERIAREVPGVDIVVVGIVQGTERQRLGNPMTRTGDAFIVEPGEELQTVAHVVLQVDATQSAVPEPGAWQVVPSRAQRQAELSRVEQQIAELELNPEAEVSFVQRLRAERERLVAEMDAAVVGAAVATFEQAKITCKLPVDDTAKQELVGYNAWVAEGNKARFAGVKAPPAAAGAAGYVGIDECEACHDEAVAFWKTTVHARAYQTLVNTNQEFDLSCVSCHVTGFREPGGSEVVENAGLVDVQCEVCHGPGSLHAATPDKDGKALDILLDSPETICAQCHTPEHSDTFDYVAYMRDIVGEGHGPARREKLGDGPTGAKLRAEGLARAGGACKKM